MKHIKLFEQFNEEEPWWEEESPFDDFLPKLIVGKNGPYFYALEDIGNGRVRIFDGTETDIYNKNTFDYREKPRDKDDFRIFGNKFKNYCKYKDLPKEIKDRLIYETYKIV